MGLDENKGEVSRNARFNAWQTWPSSFERCAIQVFGATPSQSGNRKRVWGVRDIHRLVPAQNSISVVALKAMVFSPLVCVVVLLWWGAFLVA